MDFFYYLKPCFIKNDTLTQYSGIDVWIRHVYTVIMYCMHIYAYLRMIVYHYVVDMVEKLGIILSTCKVS